MKIARSLFATLLLVPIGLASACGSDVGETMASDGLVFVRRVGSDTDLFRARLSDGSVKALWTTPERAEMWPYWSAGAGKLVFEVLPYEGGERPAGAEHDDPDQRLLLFDPKSGTESLLSKAPALIEHWADWSPTGDRVAFAFSSHFGEEPSAGLATVELASRVRTVVGSVNTDSRLFRARFSPDGQALVAQRFSNARRSSKLWIFPFGGAPRPLTAGQDGVDAKPRFTRDSQFVTFTRRDKAHGDGDIWIIARDGSNAQSIFSAADADDHAADPSPVRDEIAFASNRSGNYDIWLADLGSGELRNLTNSPEVDEAAPHFSPDGERLVVSRTRAGIDPKLPPEARPVPRLAVIDREGRVLFETQGFSPDWMPPWR